MLLIVGIGSDLLSSFYAKMGKNVLNYEDLAVMLIFLIALQHRTYARWINNNEQHGAKAAEMYGQHLGKIDK